MNSHDLQGMLHRAQESLSAAITCVDEDPEAAIDDLAASRLLIATVILALQQRSPVVG